MIWQIWLSVCPAGGAGGWTPPIQQVALRRWWFSVQWWRKLSIMWLYRSSWSSQQHVVCNVLKHENDNKNVWIHEVNENKPGHCLVTLSSVIGGGKRGAGPPPAGALLCFMFVVTMVTERLCVMLTDRTDWSILLIIFSIIFIIITFKMLLGQRRRRCREFTGPTPHSVAVVSHRHTVTQSPSVPSERNQTPFRNHSI